MPLETNYKTKLVVHILIASMTFLLLAVFLLKLDIPCVFKSIFHINCPACGLTRSFKALLNLNIVDSLKYNLLGIPLFLSIIIIYILYFLDLILKKDYLLNIYNKVVNKYPILITILIINMLINNLK